MSPTLTGSVRLIPTMGIVRVAFLAAMTAGVGDAAMTSTFRRTNSSARPGSRSAWPSAYRYSMRMF
jgi:hypothetical protein